MNTDEILTRGRAARELLENETFAQVVNELRDRVMQDWRNTSSGAASLREVHHAQVSALDAIEGELRSRVDAAKYEEARIEKEAQRASARRLNPFRN